jgi:hypothetical protein
LESDARKQEKVYRPEEVAAFLSDMSLDEWRKATATEKREPCPEIRKVSKFWRVSHQLGNVTPRMQYMSANKEGKKYCDCEACDNRIETGCPNSPTVTMNGKDYCNLCAPKEPVTRWTPEERGFIISYVHAINDLAEKQQASVGQYPECAGGDGIILLDIRKFGDGGHGTVDGVRLRDYFLQSTAAIVDNPVTDLPKILQAMKDGKDIVDAVMAYDEYPVVTSELVTDEPESVVNTMGPNYCTPEEVAAFLNEPLEDSDEAA